jgi:hypothetical protein
MIIKINDTQGIISITNKTKQLTASIYIFKPVRPPLGPKKYLLTRSINRKDVGDGI